MHVFIRVNASFLIHQVKQLKWSFFNSNAVLFCTLTCTHSFMVQRRYVFEKKKKMIDIKMFWLLFGRVQFVNTSIQISCVYRQVININELNNKEFPLKKLHAIYWMKLPYKENKIMLVVNLCIWSTFK